MVRFGPSVVKHAWANISPVESHDQESCRVRFAGRRFHPAAG